MLPRRIGIRNIEFGNEKFIRAAKQNGGQFGKLKIIQLT